MGFKPTTKNMVIAIAGIIVVMIIFVIILMKKLGADMFDPEYKDDGIYSYQLFMIPKKDTRITTREDALDEIDTWLSGKGVNKIFAYNGDFDKNHLPELSGYTWHDIMRLAAYKQYNRYIPDTAPCCNTGKLKRNYGVESITRLISGNTGYYETHNALRDALDELDIMRMLCLEIEAYEVGRL